MFFAKNFLNKYYSPERYVVSTNNTSYRNYCDFLNKTDMYTSNLFKNTSNWYCKPVGGTGGKNIIITKTPCDIFDNKDLVTNIYVIEKEIDPLLYKNRKFDFRIHVVLVFKNNKLSAYIENNFLCRICTEDYESDKNIYSQKLTNVSFRQNLGISVPDVSFIDLSDNFNKNEIFNKIKMIVKDMTINIINKQIDEKYKSKYLTEYSIIGMDIILDKYGKPYILEINKNPTISDGGDLGLNITTGTKYSKNNHKTIDCMLVEDILEIIKESFIEDYPIKLSLLEKIV